MARRIALLILVELTVLTLAAAVAAPRHETPTALRGADKVYPIAVRVVGRYNAHEVWVTTVVPPAFTFGVEGGKALPEEGVVRCIQENRTKTVTRGDATFTYPVVYLYCEDGQELGLTGVDFAGVKQ